MTKKAFFLSAILILLGIIELKAQVGGVSNSKLVVLNTATVDKHVFEFEPAFGIGLSSKTWDDKGKLRSSFLNNDSVTLGSDFGFRFTYGIVENLEIGVSLPVNMENSSWGIKYQIPTNGHFAFAGVAGVNFPMGSVTYNKKHKEADRIASLAGGLVLRYNFTDALSFDIDAQYQKYIAQVDHLPKSDIFINTEAGLYIKEIVQPCIGFSYLNSNYSNDLSNVQLLSLNLGATIETAENFVLILNAPIDLIGRNINKTVSFNFSLTISIH